eukprot:s2257_g11.t1
MDDDVDLQHALAASMMVDVKTEPNEWDEADAWTWDDWGHDQEGYGQWGDGTGEVKHEYEEVQEEPLPPPSTPPPTTPTNTPVLPPPPPPPAPMDGTDSYQDEWVDKSWSYSWWGSWRHGAGRVRKRKRGSGEMGVRAMELAQTLAEAHLANAGSSSSRG